MRVELVEHNPGHSATGIGRYTRELYKHLSRLSDCVSVRLTSNIDPPFASRLAFLHHLPLRVRGHQPGSIVHFTQIMGCSQMLWNPVRPAVATVHDLGVLVWAPEARMFRVLDRFLLHLSYLGLKQMDAIITVSEYSRQTVMQRLRVSSQRVFAIHSGNNNQLFRPVPGARMKLEARYSLPGNSKYNNLLYVGSELPRKNLITLLRALSLLPSQVRLLKVGPPGGEDFRRSTKKLIAELELNNRVFFFDHVPDEDLPLLYSAADVYVSASFLEGFGHPILEAMACGTPVVCSNSASLPEIAGDAALLVSPSDTHAFAEAVLAVLDNDGLRAQMVARGLKRSAKFSWERTAEDTMAVYHLVARSDEGRV